MEQWLARGIQATCQACAFAGPGEGHGFPCEQILIGNTVQVRRDFVSLYRYCSCMRCLLVEDERKVADFVTRGFRAERFAVDVAHDGNTGWEYASRFEYD